MMKKTLMLLMALPCLLFYAQQGKVGINTSTPGATLEVVSKANTQASKALKISNSATAEMVTVRDNGQVGINQATPATDALLELNATNKSLLLTRVNSPATDIASPVNGMLVYDITKKCVVGYENGAWSACLSATSGGGGGSTGSPPTLGAEQTPCGALENPRDFVMAATLGTDAGMPLFISENGYIYGGWGIDSSNLIGYGEVGTSEQPGFYNFSTTGALFTALPAANILKYLPNAKWNKILTTQSNAFGITEGGKMYVWGGRLNAATDPVSGILTTYTKRGDAEIPREILNPDGNLWKDFYKVGTEIIFAVDSTGKWWSWGGNTINGYYTRTAFAYTSGTASYYLTPNHAAALVPAPKYDPNNKYTFAGIKDYQDGTFVYIGTDNKVYTYGRNVGAFNGPLVTTPQEIAMPTGVTAVKILGTVGLNNFVILGNNGIIYRVGNGDSFIPGTGFTATALTTSTYNFKDMVLGDKGNIKAIYGVPKNGGDIINLGLNWNTSLFVQSTEIMEGTSRFNITHLWSDKFDDIILKDGTSGDLYTFNSSYNNTAAWARYATAGAMFANDPNNVNLNWGPMKLISCVSPAASSSTGTGTGSGGTATTSAKIYSWETDLRFKQFAIVKDETSGFYTSGGVTTDGKVFFWGRDSWGTLDYISGGTPSATGSGRPKGSPVFISGAGTWETNAVKVQLGGDGYFVMDSNGKVWSFGLQRYGQLGNGINQFYGQKLTISEVIKPSGVTSFTDMVMRAQTLVLLGNNGNVYAYGMNPNTGSGMTNALQITFPAGVTSYTKIWQANENSGSRLFMLGNDGNLYTTGTQYDRILNGNTADATSTTNPVWGTSIFKVNLPAGEGSKLVKVDSDNTSAFALTSEGKLYAWGKIIQDFGAGVNTVQYPPQYECRLVDESSLTMVTNAYGYREYYAYEPKLVKLPAGETSFTDFTAGFTNNEFLCASGKAYVAGYEGPLKFNESGVMGAYNYPIGTKFSDYRLIYALEPVANLKQIISPGFATLALDASGKLWGYGFNEYCMTGAGFNCPNTIPVALPLMNGNLDPNNPRPQTVN